MLEAGPVQPTLQTLAGVVGLRLQNLTEGKRRPSKGLAPLSSRVKVIDWDAPDLQRDFRRVAWLPPAGRMPKLRSASVYELDAAIAARASASE